jgi:hypothetical protein
MGHEFPEGNFWWGPKLLPKSGTMIVAAPPKAGKSLTIVSIIKALVMGKPVFGHEYFQVPQACRVLYVEQEVMPEGIQDRCRKAFTPEEWAVSGDNFYCLSGHPEVNFSTEQGYRLIVDEVERVKPAVLILDPIANLHTYKENDATEMTKFFLQVATLVKLGIGWGLSVIMVHHLKKPDREVQGYDDLDPNNIRGSGVLFGRPDTMVMLSRRQQLKVPLIRKYPEVAYDAWAMKVRIVPRHSARVNDLWLHCNEDEDMLVKFEKIDGLGAFATGGLPKFGAKPGIKSAETVSTILPEPPREIVKPAGFFEGPKVKTFG